MFDIKIEILGLSWPFFFVFSVTVDMAMSMTITHKDFIIKKNSAPTVVVAQPMKHRVLKMEKYGAISNIVIDYSSKRSESNDFRIRYLFLSKRL